MKKKLLPDPPLHAEQLVPVYVQQDVSLGVRGAVDAVAAAPPVLVTVGILVRQPAKMPAPLAEKSALPDALTGVSLLATMAAVQHADPLAQDVMDPAIRLAKMAAIAAVGLALPGVAAVMDALKRAVRLVQHVEIVQGAVQVNAMGRVQPDVLLAVRTAEPATTPVRVAVVAAVDVKELVRALAYQVAKVRVKTDALTHAAMRVPENVLAGAVPIALDAPDAVAALDAVGVRRRARALAHHLAALIVLELVMVKYQLQYKSEKEGNKK